MTKLLAVGLAAIGATLITSPLHKSLTTLVSPPTLTKHEVDRHDDQQPRLAREEMPPQLKNFVGELRTLPESIKTSLTPPEIEATFSMSDSIILILAIALMLVIGGFSYTFLAVKKED